MSGYTSWFRHVFASLACGIAFSALTAQAVPPIDANCGSSGGGGNPATTGLAPPDVFNPVDEFGVDLQSGAFHAPMPAISIGPAGAGGLTYQRSFDTGNYISDIRWRDNFVGTLNSRPIFCGSPPYDSLFTATVNGQSIDFYKHGSGSPAGFWSMSGGAATLVQSGSDFTLTLGDGTVVTYLGSLAGQGTHAAINGRVSTVVRPDGETHTYHYTTFVENVAGTDYTFKRLQSVTTNLGYQLHFEYLNPASRVLVKVVALNNQFESCGVTAESCGTLTNTWPSLTFATAAGQETATDALGRTTTFLISNKRVTEIRRPGYPVAAAISVGYGSGANAGKVVQLNNGAGTWTYAYANVTTPPSGYPATATTTRTNPLSQSTVVQVVTSESFEFPPGIVVSAVKTVTDPSGEVTTYGHDEWGKLTVATLPEGNKVALVYDGRGNIAELRQISKTPGTPADIVETASYPPTCSNAKTCNQPVWVQDARGAQTDFTYDAGHGGVLTATSPAPGSGPYAAIRPQTRYIYNANGTAVTRLASTSTCSTTATCANAATETVTSTTYDTLNRKPLSVTTRSGDSAIVSTVAMTYTPQGDVATRDGPLTGTADTSYAYFDAMRQLRASVSPDPDGGGALLHRVTRTTYTLNGQPELVEAGAVASPANWNSLSVLQRLRSTYDAQLRLVKEERINPATSQTEALTQYSHDAAGRLQCSAVRMNKAVYGSLPGACTLSTAGAFGPDRISRTLYMANGDIDKIQTGYGTALQRNERTYTYLAPGLVSTLTDAKGNRTTHEYDGFNRLLKVRYPSPTTPGTSSTTDYEQFGYDPAGNVTSERRRDGLMIANTYDALNRQRTRTGSSVPDVTSSYDNLSRLITASQPGTSLSWAYDALGRQTSETQPLGTVSSLYDAAGRRTRLTWPGGAYVTYEYDTTDALTLIRESGATVLATHAYDNLGRLTAITRDNGGVSSYAYDGAQRLDQIALSLPTGGGAHNLTLGYDYNPAGQLTLRTSSNTAYDWPYAVAATETYTSNGLNQYVTARGASPTYDGRGNLTSAGAGAFGYDGHNRLVSGPGGASLGHDPAGRLMQVAKSGVTTQFLYDGTRLIAEYDGAGTLLRRYVHGPGVDQPLVWYEGAGTSDKRRLYADERGSVIAVEAAGGVTKNTYDAYGVPGAGNAGRFQYTGQAWLSEVSLYHYKARAYAPLLGRFLQADPIEYADQMNLYAYVGNDPVNAVDPTGREGEFIFGGQDKHARLSKAARSHPGEVAAVGLVGLAGGTSIVACLAGGCEATAALYMMHANTINAVGLATAHAAGDPGRGASALENGLVQTAKSMIGGLRSLHAAGQTTETVIAGRTVIYQSDLPMQAMTLTEEGGFVIGPKAFESSEELAKTVLHELRRLDQGLHANGVSSDVARSATDDAFDFAERHYKEVLE